MAGGLIEDIVNPWTGNMPVQGLAIILITRQPCVLYFIKQKDLHNYSIYKVRSQGDKFAEYGVNFMPQGDIWNALIKCFIWWYENESCCSLWLPWPVMMFLWLPWPVMLFLVASVTSHDVPCGFRDQSCCSLWFPWPVMLFLVASVTSHVVPCGFHDQ
jgi:hypothetical protein